MAIIYTNQSSGYSRKNKKKMNNLSANQLAEYKEDHRIHNKHYKSKGLHSMMMTLDDYIKYRFGSLPKQNLHLYHYKVFLTQEKHQTTLVYQTT